LAEPADELPSGLMVKRAREAKVRTTRK